MFRSVTQIQGDYKAYIAELPEQPEAEVRKLRYPSEKEIAWQGEGWYFFPTGSNVMRKPQNVAEYARCVWLDRIGE